MHAHRRLDHASGAVGRVTNRIVLVVSPDIAMVDGKVGWLIGMAEMNSDVMQLKE